MFIYNQADETYFDADRNARVSPGGGPGHQGAYSAQVKAPGWSFEFMILRESDRIQFGNGEVIKEPDYQVKIIIRTYAGEGIGENSPLMREIAKEIALLRESQLYKSDPSRLNII